MTKARPNPTTIILIMLHNNNWVRYNCCLHRDGIQRQGKIDVSTPPPPPPTNPSPYLYFPSSTRTISLCLKVWSSSEAGLGRGASVPAPTKAVSGQYTLHPPTTPPSPPHPIIPQGKLGGKGEGLRDPSSAPHPLYQNHVILHRARLY